jgi:hypothetical protein
MKIFDEAEKKGIQIENKYISKLKDLQGDFEFTINHIGDKHLIFLNKLGAKGKKQTVTREMLNQIFKLTEKGCARSEIANSVGLSIGTIYTYQKQMGLL